MLLLKTLGVIALVISPSFGCAAGPSPVTTVEPMQDPISEAAIEQEMQALHARAIYGIAFSLLGGTAGLVLGAKIGYEIDYAHDIRQGCEDCGLGGALLGGAIGVVTGIVGGAVVGTKVGAHADRAEAIRRIRARRGRG